MKDLQELAEEAGKLFIKANRPDGSQFTKLDHSAPEWLSDLVREAHGEMLPDDYKYEFIEEALSAIEDNYNKDQASDNVYEQLDTVTSRLTRWLASSIARVAYCDEVLENSSIETTNELLATAQRNERLEVFEIVYTELEKQLEIEHDKESEEAEEKE